MCKLRDGDPYPRYKKLREDFTQLWQEFSRYIDDSDYGVLQPSIAEVSFFTECQCDVREVAASIKALNPRWSLSGQHATAYQLECDIQDRLTTGHQSVCAQLPA